MYDPTDEELIQRILPVLEIALQYARHVEAWDQDLIAQVRRRSAKAIGEGFATDLQTTTCIALTCRFTANQQTAPRIPRRHPGATRLNRADPGTCHSPTDPSSQADCRNTVPRVT
jgi:hypothetical protein